MTHLPVEVLFFPIIGTILYTGVALAVLGAGYSAYSSYQQGQAQGKLNDYNAALADQQAQTTQRDAAIQANATRRQNARILAKQRAGFAANGIDASTGSPLLVESEQAGYLEMGALETQRQGSIEAGRLSQQAVLDRMAGKNARVAGTMNATATALSGAGNAAAMYKGIK
jgi:hypothetical protein